MGTAGEHVITLERLRRSFALHLTGLSPSTVTSYTRGLDHFLAFRDAHDLPASAADVKPDDVREFLAEQEDRGLKPNTLRARFKALKAFFKWATAEPGTGVDVNPMDNVRAPIIPEADDVPPLSDDEMRALLGTCKGNGFCDVRDAAVIRLMYDTGMRRAEVIGMTTDSIDWDAKEPEVKIAGKGRRPRRAPLSGSTITALDRYDLLRGDAGTDAFWLARDRRTPWARSGIANMLDRRSERAGIGHVHPHRLRHTYISCALAAGVSECNVCEITGTSREQLDATYAKATRSQRARDAGRKLALGDTL